MRGHQLGAEKRAVQYTTFCTYWHKLLPHVMITKPQTDLCWTCKQNSIAIMKAVNRLDHEKSQMHVYVTRFVKRGLIHAN